MLIHPTLNKLQELRLQGMKKAFAEQLEQVDIKSLSFEERLGLLVDREVADRETRRLTTRLKKAKLKQPALLEDIDYQQPRGLDKAYIRKLSDCSWIKEKHNILIVGPTGTGKTYLACALAHKACLQGYTSFYARVPRILPELIINKADGQYVKKMRELAKTDVLVLDDWGLLTLNAEQRRELLEILDDRHGNKSTIVTSQLPINLWHETINDVTLADAILDRIVHNAYRIEMSGESMRKVKSNLTKLDKS